MAFTASDICKILVAIFLPPLGVFLERGCGADFLINILLTILGWVPGVIHALYIILKYWDTTLLVYVSAMTAIDGLLKELFNYTYFDTFYCIHK